jgi:hypothetical protein
MKHPDQVLGLELLKGPVNPVFKHSRIPDYRFLSDEEQFSPSNLARYEIYRESLNKVGVHPVDFVSRTITGLRCGLGIQMGSKFVAPEQAGVQDFEQVV